MGRIGVDNTPKDQMYDNNEEKFSLISKYSKIGQNDLIPLFVNDKILNIERSEFNKIAPLIYQHVPFDQWSEDARKILENAIIKRTSGFPKDQL